MNGVPFVTYSAHLFDSTAADVVTGSQEDKTVVNRIALLTAGALSGLAVAVGSANAWGSFSRTTYVGFNRPVGLPGLTLDPGTYVFELADSSSSLAIVRVMNEARTVIYFMEFTEQVTRPAGLPANQSISFGEAPPGVAPPITAWYPNGESTGRRFLYAKRR